MCYHYTIPARQGGWKLVRAKRLELIRLAAPEPKSGASANSATPAFAPNKKLVTRRRFELRTP